MKLDDIRKLHQKKYRQLHQKYLVEGEHLILELERATKLNPALTDTELYVTEQHKDWSTPFRKHVVSQKVMAQLSDTKTPQGLLAVTPIQTAVDASDQISDLKAIYLHEIQDPGNLGTIIRTLGWFGGFRLLLSPNSVDPFNPKVVRSSMGAIFHVPMELDVDLMSLPHRFRNIATLDMQGEHMSHASFRSCDCYVFGNEARGVPRAALETIDPHTFTIAGCGAIESLNLATAVNMAAYEINRL
ncbi:MAG: RNA methyltransferase [Pseudomonadota bacterium]|nr:RNA methyltransferase [Pseudomonadota bacterium]